MMAWVLLFLTAVSGFMVFDVLRWQRTMEKMPFSAISYLWGKQSLGKPLHEQEKIKQNYISYMGNKMIGMLLAITLLLAKATYQAFME